MTAINDSTWAVPPVKKRRFSWVFVFGTIIGIGLFFMLMVPTMCRSSESANRIKCGSNLRQLGLYLSMYGNEHGVLPPDWKTLVAGSDVTAETFVCASSADERDTNPDRLAWAAGLEDPKGHSCSFVYVGSNLPAVSLGQNDIVAFDKDGNHGDDVTNLLFGDGHVEYLGIGGSRRAKYDRLLADHAAGVRPLRLR